MDFLLIKSQAFLNIDLFINNYSAPSLKICGRAVTDFFQKI